MRELIKKIYYNSSIGRNILLFPKYLYDQYRYHILSDEKYIKQIYKRTFGYDLDLNNPQAFTEKLQWLKLNNRSELLTMCADKLRVRDYIHKKIGAEYLIPLVFSTNNIKDINIDNLPDEPVIIKTTHDSGGVIIVQDKKNADFKSIRKKLKKKMNTNYSFIAREWEYKNIKPAIIVEKLLQDETHNAVLNDYKIHCLNGIPLYIQTIFDRVEEVKENWYDTDWNLLDVYYFSPIKKEIPKPEFLNQLLEIAKCLSADFIYVRVDLYISNNKIYFGELTFRPCAGLMKFIPEGFNQVLGQQLRLPQH